MGNSYPWRPSRSREKKTGRREEVHNIIVNHDVFYCFFCIITFLSTLIIFA
jgi:hypothetical protein